MLLHGTDSSWACSKSTFVRQEIVHAGGTFLLEHRPWAQFEVTVVAHNRSLPGTEDGPEPQFVFTHCSVRRPLQMPAHLTTAVRRSKSS